MIDITEKPKVRRIAEAAGSIDLRRETVEGIKANRIKKGDVLEISKIAGIQWAKRTWDLIPHCHQIPLTSVEPDTEITSNGVEVKCTVVAQYGTGVEMEALSCVTGMLLTIWDMVKYIEKDESGNYPHTAIRNIRVIRKEKL